MKNIIKSSLYVVLLAITGLVGNQKAIAQSCTVNLLIAYTDKTADSLKGDKYAFTKIAEAVQSLNAAYTSSGVNHQVLLVRTVRLTNFETGCFANDLNSFQASVYINDLRDKYHADIAVLIFTNDEFCGLPYLADSIANSTTAYCAVNYGCMISNFALSHQVGHLYGCSHYVEELFPSGKTPYKYGHGFKLAESDDKNAVSFSTIMGVYDDDFCDTSSGTACNVIPYFSNPAIKYMNIPLGVPGIHDNARVLNQNDSVMAALKVLPRNQLNLSDTVNLFNIAIAEAADTLATGTHYRIIDNSSVSFQAGKRIELNPGFSVAYGSKFVAFIDTKNSDCSTNAQKKPK